jgi:hypothetical protein
VIREATGQVVPRAASDSSMSVIAIFRQLGLHQRILHYVELSQTVRRLLANRG